MRFTVPEECLLLELPREIRERIYHALYRDVGECTLLIITKENNVERLSSRDDTYNEEGDIFRPHATALLRTCKQIHHEAAPALLDLADFRIILAGLLSYSPRGKFLGNIDSCRFLSRIRRVRLTLANDIETTLHNLELFVHAQENNAKLDVRAIYLDFNFLITSTCPQHDLLRGKTERLIEGLRQLPCKGVPQVYNMSQPGSYVIPDYQMAHIVAGVGGKDYTFPEREQRNRWRPKARHTRQEVEKIIADEEGWMDCS